MKFWERLGNVDRRIIYLIMAIVVIVPLVATIKLPSKVRAMPRTKDIFNHIEQIDPEARRKALILSVDFDPQVEPELRPQMESVMRHTFARDIPLVVLCISSIQSVDIAREAVERIGNEHGKVYGEDYVFLGWKPGYHLVILGLGNFIDRTFPTDYYGTDLGELPMMEDIRNYDDVGLVINFTGASVYTTWIIYANTRFGVPLATGVTSVSVADIYPYLGSGQLIGMLAGMKAAAEYERLTKERYYPDIEATVLEPNSYKVKVSEQSFEADSVDMMRIADRFGVNLTTINEALASEGKFVEEILLSWFPNGSSYTRNISVVSDGKRPSVTLESQELNLNRDEMLAIADYYFLSGATLDTILRLELREILKNILGDQVKVEDNAATIESKVTSIIQAEFANVLAVVPEPEAVETEEMADTLVEEMALSADALLRAELAALLVEKITRLSTEPINQTTAEGILRTELTEMLEGKPLKKAKKGQEEVAVERSIFMRGTQALPALSASLIVIIVFVIIGNISYFATRRKK